MQLLPPVPWVKKNNIGQFKYNVWTQPVGMLLTTSLESWADCKRISSWMDSANSYICSSMVNLVWSPCGRTGFVARFPPAIKNNGAVDKAASGRLLSYAQDRVLDASGVLQICKPCLQCQTPTARRCHHLSMWQAGLVGLWLTDSDSG